MTKYVIRDDTTKRYYSGWTGIGPSMGATLVEAERFDTKDAAVVTMSRHSLAFGDSKVMSEGDAASLDAGKFVMKTVVSPKKKAKARGRAKKKP